MKPLRAVLLDFGGTLALGGPPPEESDRLGSPALERFLAERLPGGSAPEAVRAFLRLRRERLETAARSAVETPALDSLRAALEEVRVPPLAEGELLAGLDAFFAREEASFREAPGALESLDAVRGAGLATALVSNNSHQPSIARTLRRLGFADRLDAEIHSSAILIRKPDPRIFRAAARALRVEPRTCVHVGDIPSIDVAGARASDMRAVLAKLDPSSPAGEADGPVPDAVLTHFRDLPRIVAGLSAR